MVAQCPDKWVQQISPLPSGTIINAIPSMVVDDEGNVVVSNFVYNADSLSAGNSVFDDFAATFVNTDVFVAKYSNSGVLQWMKAINGVGLTSSQDLATDAEGNVYVSGYFSTSMTVDDSVFTHIGSAGLGYFIMKLNENGELQWVRTNEHRGSVAYCIQWTEIGLAFAIPFADSVEVDGQMFYTDPQLYAGAQDILFGVLDADGQLVQSSLIEGEGSLGISAMSCNAEGCILQGRFEKELIRGNLTLTTPAQDHYALYQLYVEFDGNPFWAHASSNASNFFVAPFGLGISDDSTAVFALQYLYTGFDLDGLSVPAPSLDPNSPDMVVGKLRLSDGSVKWLKEGDGNEIDVLTDLSADGANTVLAGGSDSPLFAFEGYEQTNSGGLEDGYVISIDEDGKSRCGLGFHGNGQERVRQVHVNDDGTLFALVSVTDDLSIDGINYLTQGAADLLLVKTCLDCDTLTDIKEILNADEFVLLQNDPNPFSDYTDISYEATDCVKCQMVIVDVNGRLVKRIKLNTASGMIRLYSSEIGNGLFTYSLLQDGQVIKTQKMVSTKR